jgi:hypothetical protein
MLVGVFGVRLESRDVRCSRAGCFWVRLGLLRDSKGTQKRLKKRDIWAKNGFEKRTEKEGENTTKFQGLSFDRTPELNQKETANQSLTKRRKEKKNQNENVKNVKNNNWRKSPGNRPKDRWGHKDKHQAATNPHSHSPSPLLLFQIPNRLPPNT